MKRSAAALALALAAALAAHEAMAQRYPGRERGEVLRESPRHEREPNPVVIRAPDPFVALERELPSLKVDLRLTPEQARAWSALDRGVRQLAELDRQQRRRLLALQGEGATPPSALQVIADFAEEDRRRAELSAELRRHFEVLYVLLDEAQQKMMDRRLVLSQNQPLGQELARPRR